MNKKASKVLLFFDTFFEFTDWIRKSIIKFDNPNTQKIINKIADSFTTLEVILSILLFIIPIKPVLYFTVGTFALSGIIILIKKPSNTLTSLRSFVSRGFLNIFIISIAFYSVITSSIKFDSIIFHDILFLLIYFLFWLLYSCIADNDVAVLGNLFFSTVLTLLTFIKDFIFCFIPENIDINSNITIYGFSYSQAQLLEISINLFLIPLLIVNIIITFICALKGYWIKKYSSDSAQNIAQK